MSSQIVSSYIQHGWALVPIAPGSKAPTTSGWNKRESIIKSTDELPHGYGVGIAHAYSGTMALDVDNWDLATEALQKDGIDLTTMLMDGGAVSISSGRPGRAKLLYKLDQPLPTKKIVVNNITAYELRCATTNGLSVQDVLPPSIHPETHKPYEWKGQGHWTHLPSIPKELLNVWVSMTQTNRATCSTQGGVPQGGVPQLGVPEEAPAPLGSPVAWDLVSSALHHLSPTCSREEWIKVGMALKHAGTQDGYVEYAQNLWMNWSSTSSQYPGDKEADYQWSSLNLNNSAQVTLGSLFKMAKDAGWERPQPKVILPPALFPNLAPLTVQNIKDSTVTNPPKINIDLFPELLRVRAQELSKQQGADPIIPLFAGLAAASGAANAQSRLELLPGFQVPPVIWVMTIGSPAQKKSPASKPMFQELKEIEKEDKKRYAKDIQEWKGHEAQHAQTYKDFLKFCESQDFINSPNNAPHIYELPPEPQPLRLLISDITSQKLVQMASGNPQGMLCHLDEMHGWIRKITDKRAAEDRSSWVVAFESDSHVLDRVGSGTHHADNLAVSIYGNIQPRVLAEHMDDLSSDGLIQRFLPAILEEGNQKQWGTGQIMYPHETHQEQWNSAIRRIHNTEQTIYKLSQEAYEAFKDFQQEYVELRDNYSISLAPDAFMGALGKLEGQIGRLTLLFHLIKDPFNEIVPVETLKDVIELFFTYFIKAIKYVLCEAGKDPFQEWLTDFILQRSDIGTISAADIKKAAARYMEKMSTWEKDKLVDESTQQLCSLGWMKLLSPETANPRYAKWAVNPEIGTMFKDEKLRVICAKQQIISSLERDRNKAKPSAYGYVQHRSEIDDMNGVRW